MPREATFIVPLKAGTQDPHIPLSCVSPCLPGGLQSPPTFAAERPTNLLGLIPSPNKERGPGWPTVVSSCLLWTGTTGPAGWNLTLLERAHCPVMRGPCSGHWPAQAGAQRGAGSTAPTSVIRNRAPLLQPPAVAHSWPSPHPTSAALLSPNPATHLGRGSSSPAQAWFLAPRCPRTKTSILASTLRPSVTLTVWPLFSMPTVAPAAGISPNPLGFFISLRLCSCCFGCQECPSSLSRQTPTHPPKPSSDVTASSSMVALLCFPGLRFRSLYHSTYEKAIYMVKDCHPT